MSVCTFLAANCPLPTVSPSRDYPLHINIDTGTIDDGGADDNFFLRPFPDVDLYSDKSQGVALEWPQYTPGRAKQILSYIETTLTRTDTVELWLVWLGNFTEYEDRPRIHSFQAAISELVPEDLHTFCNQPIWDAPHSQRPSFYRLTIHR